MSGSRSSSPNHPIILKNTIILAEALRRLDAHRDRLALTRTGRVSRRTALFDAIDSFLKSGKNLPNLSGNGNGNGKKVCFLAEFNPVHYEEFIQRQKQRFRLIEGKTPADGAILNSFFLFWLPATCRWTWATGPDKGCTYISPEWFEFTGTIWDKSKGFGWIWANVVHPEDLPECIRRYNKAFDEGKAFLVVYRLRCSTGEYVWVRGEGKPDFGPDQNVVGFRGHAIVITDPIDNPSLMIGISPTAGEPRIERPSAKDGPGVQGRVKSE